MNWYHHTIIISGHFGTLYGLGGGSEVGEAGKLGGTEANTGSKAAQIGSGAGIGVGLAIIILIALGE